MAQSYEDETNECIMALEGNISVLSKLLRYYQKLMKRNEIPNTIRQKCQGYVDVFVDEIQDIIDDMNTQVGRARLLLRIVGDRKALVSENGSRRPLPRPQH